HWSSPDRHLWRRSVAAIWHHLWRRLRIPGRISIHRLQQSHSTVVCWECCSSIPCPPSLFGEKQNRSVDLCRHRFLASAEPRTEPPLPELNHCSPSRHFPSAIVG